MLRIHTDPCFISFAKFSDNFTFPAQAIAFHADRIEKRSCNIGKQLTLFPSLVIFFFFSQGSGYVMIKKDKAELNSVLYAHC